MEKKQSILLEKLTPIQANCICEDITSDDGKKKLCMKGIFIQGGVRNHNERIYPVKEIEKAVDELRGKIKEFNGVCGEIDHPESLSINLDRISHKITEMWMDGPNGMGKLEIIPTPSGNIIRTLIESGVKLGVSSRGVGEVSSQGIVSDYSIVTIDVVLQPSGPDAFPKPVYESRLSTRGRIISDLAESVSNDPKAQKHLTKELLAWINNLK